MLKPQYPATRSCSAERDCSKPGTRLTQSAFYYASNLEDVDKSRARGRSPNVLAARVRPTLNGRPGVAPPAYSVSFTLVPNLSVKMRGPQCAMGYRRRRG